MKKTTFPPVDYVWILFENKFLKELGSINQNPWDATSPDRRQWLRFVSADTGEDPIAPTYRTCWVARRSLEASRGDQRPG